MNILEKEITDTYKDKKKVIKTVRLDKDTALKVDKILNYCIQSKGRKISQNDLLKGIITYVIQEYEHRVQLNPEKANKRILYLIDDTPTKYK